MTENTPTSGTTTSGYSAFIPEIWSQKLNNMLSKECVMLQCVNRNYEGEIKNQGDTVKIITPAENPRPIERAFMLSFFVTKATTAPIAVASPAKSVIKSAIP